MTIERLQTTKCMSLQMPCLCNVAILETSVIRSCLSRRYWLLLISNLSLTRFVHLFISKDTPTNSFWRKFILENVLCNFHLVGRSNKLNWKPKTQFAIHIVKQMVDHIFLKNVIFFNIYNLDWIWILSNSLNICLCFCLCSYLRANGLSNFFTRMSNANLCCFVWFKSLRIH